MKNFILFLGLILLAGCDNSIDSTGGSSNTRSSDVPNMFSEMWNINPNSIYQQRGLVKKDADINLLDLWKLTYGEGVKVAVIDDCFDVSHDDLKDNIYKTYDANTGAKEVGGYNCHGTEVASVIGAVKNSFGIIGVAPKIELILIKINLENSTELDFVNAFEYAKKQGARVINCSWGSNNEGQILADELYDIRRSGIVTVFASGNNGINLDRYDINDESEDPNVIGVGSTEGETNDVAEYSNYGKNIDILAPGGSLDLGVIVLGDGDQYYEATGTSYSAPAVAGVAALLLSLDSSLTFGDIYQKIVTTADKIGLDRGANYIYGFDIRRAYGKINASNTIK